MPHCRPGIESVLGFNKMPGTLLHYMFCRASGFHEPQTICVSKCSVMKVLRLQVEVRFMEVSLLITVRNCVQIL